MNPRSYGKKKLGAAGAFDVAVIEDIGAIEAIDAIDATGPPAPDLPARLAGESDDVPSDPGVITSSRHVRLVEPVVDL